MEKEGEKVEKNREKGKLQLPKFFQLFIRAVTQTSLSYAWV